MDIKCACCHNVYVEREGDICFNCRLKGLSAAEPAPDYSSSPQRDVVEKNGEFGEKHSAKHAKEKERKNEDRTFGKVVVRGTVFDFKKEPDTRSQMERFSSALFKGTPYTYSKEKYIFNVKEDNVRSLNFDGRTGSCVVINGDFTFGSITNNDVVEVTGSRNKYGVIAAEKIVNISNGSRINISKQVNASVIRLITLLVVGLIVLTGYLAVTKFIPLIGEMSSGSLNTSGKEVLKSILCIVVGILMIVFSVRFGRSFGSRTKTVILAVGAGLILFAISPSLLVSVLGGATCIYCIFKLIKTVFR